MISVHVSAAHALGALQVYEHPIVRLYTPLDTRKVFSYLDSRHQVLQDMAENAIPTQELVGIFEMVGPEL